MTGYIARPDTFWRSVVDEESCGHLHAEQITAWVCLGERLGVEHLATFTAIPVEEYLAESL